MVSMQIDASGLREASGLFRRAGAELAVEPTEILVAIADEVLVPEAEASIERAKAIPLLRSTIERRSPRKTGIRRRRKRKRGKKYKRGKPPRSFTPLNPDSDKGLGAALMNYFHGRGPWATREIRGRQLEWGTKRWVSEYANFLRTGTRRMVARLDFMATPDSQEAVGERINQKVLEHLHRALAKAGVPEEWMSTLVRKS